MTRPPDLMAILRDGGSILMDGALGTELERRGVPIEGRGWSAQAVRDHGGVIEAIHRDYLEAGAALHIVNSFALARHVLEPIGLADQFEFLNRRAVALFEQAASANDCARESLWVAGSLSTFCAHSDRSQLPRGETLVGNCRDQARILHDAGVDLFALEMLFDVEVSRAMLRGVADFGLPVIAGFTCGMDASGNGEVVTLPGLGTTAMPLREVIAGVAEAAGSVPLVMSIMHSDAEATDAALEVLRQSWSGPVAIYPNSGQFVDLHLQFDTVSGEDEFEQAAERWLQQGVQIVGGCCGIGPSHIRRLGGKLTHS